MWIIKTKLLPDGEATINPLWLVVPMRPYCLVMVIQYHHSAIAIVVKHPATINLCRDNNNEPVQVTMQSVGENNNQHVRQAQKESNDEWKK